jgi:hypothetical protein
MGKILSPCRTSQIYKSSWSRVYITDISNVKCLPQCNQLYSVSEIIIIIMLELQTLPTNLSDNIEFFLNT